MTDVPPNASELVAQAGATITDYGGAAIAEAVIARLADPADWRDRREAARSYARRFDWNGLFDVLMRRLEPLD